MITIRKSDKNDAKSIIALDREWEKEGTTWPLEIYYRRPNIEKTLIKQIKKGFCFVAEENSAVIGYIRGATAKSKENWPSYYLEKGQKYGEIESFYIKKEYRKKNLGKKMVKILLEEFKKNRAFVVSLWTSSKNVWGLVNFYKRFGFEERYVNMVLNLNKSRI